MKSLQLLKQEHRTILAMLAIVETAAPCLEQGGDLSSTLLAGALDFFAHFAHGSHRTKEERILFPLLAAHGLGPDAAPLIDQHNACCVYLEDMRSAVGRLHQGDISARDDLVALIRSYVALLRGHIQLEDAYYFRLAADVLSAAEDRKIFEQMDRIRGTRGEKNDRRHYWRLIAKYRNVVATWRVSSEEVCHGACLTGHACLRHERIG